MPEALTIRPASEADLPAVLALYAQPGMDDGTVMPLADAKAVFARFARYPDYTLYVAEADGAVVGSYALLIMDNLGHLGTPSAVIEDVVVTPDRQGGGIGRRMMQHALDVARDKGCYKAVLSSNMKRERAHAFYDGLGFERHGYSFRIGLERSASAGDAA
jgi:ribosomal protein S18 acetylase RimI-like enzyme